MTVGEWTERLRKPQRWLWNVCQHSKRRMHAKGRCKACYEAPGKRRWRMKTGRFDEDALLRWIYRREDKPSNIYVPFCPRQWPVGGYSLGWLQLEPYGVGDKMVTQRWGKVYDPEAE